MNYIALFFAGVFLCNSIPHLASGLQGVPFPTPFAKPRGVGDSSPIANFLWGMFNFLIGVYLLLRHTVTVKLNPIVIIPVIGALAMGTYLSLHFGKVQRDKFERRNS